MKALIRLAKWKSRLDSLSEKPALNTLVAHGCDRTELVALLVRLQGLNTPAFTAVSKADVRSAIREIRTAHNRLFNLQFQSPGHTPIIIATLLPLVWPPAPA